MAYPSVTIASTTEREKAKPIGNIARIKRRILEAMKTLASPRKTNDSTSLSKSSRISKILCFVSNDRKIMPFEENEITVGKGVASDELNVEKGSLAQRTDLSIENPQRNVINWTRISHGAKVDETLTTHPNDEDDDEIDDDDDGNVVDSSPTETHRSDDENDWPFLEFVERIYRGKSFRVRKKVDPTCITNKRSWEIGGKIRKIERFYGSPKCRTEKSSSTIGTEECSVYQSEPLVSPTTPDTPPDITESRILTSDLDVLLRES